MCAAPNVCGVVIGPCFVIATNQRVVAAKRQQRALVAVTIRGSVLFYSSAILTDFNYATLTSLYIFQKTVECKLPLLR